MDLHIALRNIIETDGIDILKDVKLINILSDLRAFDEIPSSRYILRSIIADGFSVKFQTIGEWNNAAESLCLQFVSKTGFQYDYVHTIFLSLAYGLNWIKDVNQVNNNISANSATKASTCIPPRSNPLDSLKNSFDLKTNYGNDLGVKVENLNLTLRNLKTLVLDFELTGTFAHSFFGYISVIIYDHLGKIIQRHKGEQLYSGDYTGFIEYSYSIKLKCNIDEIGKVVMYFRPPTT